MAEGKLKSEIRGQRSEIRSQRSDVRSYGFEHKLVAADLLGNDYFDRLRRDLECHRQLSD
jgi:hypothetical protein